MPILWTDPGKRRGQVAGVVCGHVSLFSLLVHAKHLYLCLAPALFVFVLRRHVMAPGASARERLTRLLRLASVVVSVTLLSLAPVVGHSRWLQSLQQLQQRLLLWTRDLTHAYWAANLWSWYNSADWLLVQMLHRASVERQAPPVYATGLVQLFSHELLPDVSPLFADCVTAALMAPVLRLLWTRSAATREAAPLLLR